MKKIYFKEDSYTTPTNFPRALGDRLSFKTNLYFLYKLAGVVIRSRKKALNSVYDAEAFAHSSYEIFKIIEHCNGRFHLSGINNIDPENGPYVFISNHMSSMETMIFPCIITPKLDASFVVKDSLVNYPYFGEILKATQPIVVSRENSRNDLIKVLTEGQRMLAEGRSVIIFPQSTRQAEFKPETFNTLGVKLAEKSNVKVIPVAIKTDFWGSGRFVKDLGPIKRKEKIYMDFGQAFEIKEKGSIENKKIISFIKERLEEWNKK